MAAGAVDLEIPSKTGRNTRPNRPLEPPPIALRICSDTLRNIVVMVRGA
jgi:hypothetical protein